jgi:mRNA interferase MazF
MRRVQRDWPTRALRFEGREGEVALDRLRRVDRRRLVRRLGALEAETARAVAEVLGRMFAW